MDFIVTHIRSALDNQFASGGLVLMAVGAVLALLRNVPARLWSLLKDRLLYTVEIDNYDRSFAWVRDWLAEHGRSRYLMAGIAVDPENPEQTLGGGSGRRRRPQFFLCPRGLCVVRFRGRRVIAWVSREPVQSLLQQRETVTLRCLWNGRETIRALMEEAYDRACGSLDRAVEVWLSNGGYDWTLSDRKSARPVESLVLAAGVKERVILDAREFLARREWYLRMGIPWRRSYLFEGPPGNGKSSLVMVMAGELATNVNVANLSMFSDDNQLMQALMRVPKGHVILLEDVDAAFHGRAPAGGGSRGITFSGLLNAIDGVAAQEGRILVMTTNHPEKLDPALLRPGRADVRVHLDNADAEQLREMFIRFFPGHEAEAGRFSASVEPRTASMAKLQEYLLRHAEDAAAAAENAPGLARAVVTSAAA